MPFPGWLAALAVPFCLDECFEFEVQLCSFHDFPNQQYSNVGKMQASLSPACLSVYFEYEGQLSQVQYPRSVFSSFLGHLKTFFETYDLVVPSVCVRLHALVLHHADNLRIGVVPFALAGHFVFGELLFLVLYLHAKSVTPVFVDRPF